MTNNSLAYIIEKQFGKVEKDMIFVWADTFAETFLEKMTFAVNKGQYVVMLQRDKVHILTINPKKANNKVVEQTTYDLENLHRISISNMGSQKNPIAKLITFTSPNGEAHKFRVPYEAHEFDHKSQKDHLLELMDRLMPSD